MSKFQITSALRKASALAQSGEIDRARRQYELILDHFPQNRRALKALSELSDTAHAAGKSRKSANMPLSVKLSNLRALCSRGEFEKALTYGKSLTKDHPDAFMVWNLMGVAGLGLDMPDAAVSSFRKATELSPRFSEGFNNLGVALRQTDQVMEAILAHQTSLSINSNNVEALHNLGLAMHDAGRFDDAIEAFSEAIALKPDNLNSLISLSAIYREQGRKDEALDILNEALSIDPNNAQAHLGKCELVTYAVDDPDIKRLVGLLERGRLNRQDRFQLHFALAKMKEDVGDFAAAVDHYKAGGRLRQETAKYDFKQDQSYFSKIKKASRTIAKHSVSSGVEAGEVTPIFVLGMPRSGTTLVEQILSSHSEVTGAGELSILKKVGWDINLGLQDASIEALTRIRASYLEEVSKFSEGRPFVVDKMPHNFRLVGLICSAFPEARIVHTRRDAAATCWSNFKTPFSSGELDYSYNLQTVVQFYNLYKDLMAFWEQRFSERIITLDYERLTTESDAQIRSLVGALELPWEEACLKPHENKRVVRTASHQQVRRKIFKGSSDVWRKFEPFLDGAFDGLESN